jgi:hypothetical protein
MLTIMVNAPSSSNPAKSGWLELINESVHTSDDIDIGDIHAILYQRLTYCLIWR